MEYDIQFTVIIYKKKTYISHLAAIALADKIQTTNTMLFETRFLIEVKAKDKHLIKDFPIYNLDDVLQSFIEPDKSATVYKAAKKDCFVFDGLTFIALSKLQIKNKYYLRFSLPSIKIFGVYYVLCRKQKDVNTRIVVIPE